MKIIGSRGKRSDPAVGLVLVPAFGEKGSFTPLGMAYLNGALRDAGFTPTFHDVNAAVRAEAPDLHGELVAHGFSPDEGGFFGPELDLLLQIGRREVFDDAPLADRIRARAELDCERLPALDLALLTLWDSNLYYAAAIGLALRERGTVVVMGGPAAGLRIVRELLVRLGSADAVLYGEGEQRVVELARWVAGGHDFGSIGGATLRGPDGRGLESLPEPALRIHDLPRACFEGMDVDGWIPLITSRGCIRDCSFCTEKFNWRRFRQRKVEDVLDEIEGLIDQYGTQRFEFNDDLINGHVRWLDSFLDQLIERRWDLRWTCFMEPYRLTPRFIDKIAEAGCTLVKYGVQHFDPEMLRIIGRGDEVSEVVDTLRWTADHGIRVSFDIIPGHPGETEAHHAVNMRMLPEVLEGHDLLEVNLNPFLLLYGSPVHLDPEKYGVDVHTWDETLFPEPLRADFRDLAPQFIRSYDQSPDRETVIERTLQLEGVVRRVRGRHGLAAVPSGADGTPPELLDRLRARGVDRVAVRPARDSTPRHLLDGLQLARERGYKVVALETTGAPFDRAGFVKAAVRRGLSHAVLVPGGPHAVFEAAAAQLTERSVPWVLWFEPEAGDVLAARHWVSEASRLGASATVISMVSAVGDIEGQSLESAATEVKTALDQGLALGQPVVVYGLPFCLLSDYTDQLAPTPPILPISVEGRPEWTARLVQVPRCRSCGFSNRCPGAPEAALERDGESVLSPVAGRPMTDRQPTAFEALLGSSDPSLTRDGDGHPTPTATASP